ncbi:FMRFamide-activated amiloride-sensitive sodium channel [Fasciolopsis buskii]|uniref:FMRFamide-activated amiloride-sensitive sodium channel n=1 Tax=Fasciolopsis buskii TaxID=27845 RepID=A0A8E0VH86_9TREM|nr:FMRFamide-activated amiloride-sensitive sodium channel [Fasciolopsis buski]
MIISQPFYLLVFISKLLHNIVVFFTHSFTYLHQHHSSCTCKIVHFDTVRHSSESVFLILQVLHTEGSKRVLNDCEQIGRWRQFVHAQYLNCYTYDLYEAYRDHVRTIELFVYLDGPMNKTSCLDCFSSEIKSQLSGAVVVVHNSDTYPDVNQEGINIQPGSLTEIKVKTIKHTQKTPPYGRCSPDTPISIQLYGSESYAYSEHACRMSTIQAKINARCGCNAIEFPYLNESLPFCLAMSSFVYRGGCEDHAGTSRNQDRTNAAVSSTQSSSAEGNQTGSCYQELENVKKHVACKSEVTKHFQGDVVPSCTLPCAFFSYETDRSTSVWPTKSWQLSWLGTKVGSMLINRPDMENYRKARKLLASPGGEAEAKNILTSSNVLEQNLLAIMLIRPNLNLHNVEEKEVLSLTSLLSQSGGLFSIWIGINMMSVIEVLELLVHLITCCRRPAGTPNARDHGCRPSVSRIPARSGIIVSPKNRCRRLKTNYRLARTRPKSRTEKVNIVDNMPTSSIPCEGQRLDEN